MKLLLYILALSGCLGTDVDTSSESSSGSSSEELQALAINPDLGTTGISPDDLEVSFQFGEAMDETTVDERGVTFEGGDDSGTADSASLNEAGTTVTASLPSLMSTTTYTVSIGKGSWKVKTTSGKTAIGETTFDTGSSGTSDTTSPSCSTTTPSDGATNVPVSTSTLECQADEELNSADAGTCSCSPSPTMGAVTYTKSSKTFTCAVSGLSTSTSYSCTLSPKDISNNEGTKRTTFTTASSTTDSTKPTCSSTSPSGTSVALSTREFSVTWSEEIDSSSVAASNISCSPSVAMTSASAPTNSQSLYTASSETTLSGSTNYRCIVNNVKDKAGNTNTECTLSFTTATADTTSPTVSSTTPTSNATNVAVTQNLSYCWSEAMDSNSFALNQNSCTCTRKGKSSTTSFSSVSYNSTSQCSTYTHSSQWACGATCSCSLTADSTGPKDTSGNALASQYNLSFSTVACQ